MKNLHIIVEGSSEEIFVNDVMVKHFAPLNIFVSARKIRTGWDRINSKPAKGGLLKYDKFRNDAQTIRYSSISERLSVINIEFFQQAYELTYNYFSQHFSQIQRENKKLIRVDSTMVAEAANKLLEGMNVGPKKDGRKQIKYTVAFDGELPWIKF